MWKWICVIAFPLIYLSSQLSLFIYIFYSYYTIKPLNLLQFQAFSYDIASGLFIHPSLQHLNLLIQNIIIPVVLTALDVLCQVAQNEGDGVLFLLSEIRAEMFSNTYIYIYKYLLSNSKRKHSSFKKCIIMSESEMLQAVIICDQ